MKNQITTVNWHLLKACNMNCQFCYATFEDITEKRVTKAEGFRILELLAKSGLFHKINFAGGEPTLIPFLPEYIIAAKKLGLETSIVTNGSRITQDWIDSISGHLDILSLSVDSIHESTNRLSGRTVQNKPLTQEDYLQIAQWAHENGIQLKINTVVNKTNHHESLVDFIHKAQPFRWKVLQATHIEGQNDHSFLSSTQEFQDFIIRNLPYIDAQVKVVVESSELITGSYLMLDSLGRFYDSSTGKHRYSDKILEQNVFSCLSQIQIDSEKFYTRDGYYSVQKHKKVV